MNAIETLANLFHKKLEAQSGATSPLSAIYILPLKIVQQQRVSPTPAPTPAPTRRTMDHIPHLIPPDTPIPPRADTPLLGAAKYNLPSHTIHQTPQHIYTLAEEHLLYNAVTNPNTGQSLQYKQLIKGPEKVLWEQSFSNEFDRLAQGVGNRIKGINAILFKPKSAVPFKLQKPRTARLCATSSHTKKNSLHTLDRRRKFATF